jgi:hypothetical protein
MMKDVYEIENVSCFVVQATVLSLKNWTPQVFFMYDFQRIGLGSKLRVMHSLQNWNQLYLAI